MPNTPNPQAARSQRYAAELVERTVAVTWPDNDRGGATPPPDGWQARAWEQRTLHEIDEGSVSGCSVLRWRNDPRLDADLIAVSLALVSGAPLPAASPSAAETTNRAADKAPADWIDGHPQLEAIAAAVWERCEHHDSGLIIDDPRNIAVAALAAVLPAPADGPSRVAAEEQPAEIERLRTENARMRHELQVMYGGAFDSLQSAEAPQPETQAVAEEPETEEQRVRAHVTTLHLIGEQLAGIESWMWEHLANVRAAARPAVGEQPDTQTREAGRA